MQLELCIHSPSPHLPVGGSWLCCDSLHDEEENSQLNTQLMHRVLFRTQKCQMHCNGRIVHSTADYKIVCACVCVHVCACVLNSYKFHNLEAERIVKVKTFCIGNRIRNCMSSTDTCVELFLHRHTLV